MRTYSSSTFCTLTSVALVAFAFALPRASAEILRLEPNPGSFDEVEEQVGDDQGKKGKIKEDLEKAMCGGWNFDVKVEGLFKTPSDDGKIAKVERLPGRMGKPLDNIESGMADRIETGGLDSKGFDFPTNTTGFQSLCRPADYTYDVKNPHRENAPFFCEHPCQRPLGNIKPQNSSDGYAYCGGQAPDTDGIKYSCGGGQMKAPGENIAQEIQTNGPKGGLCEDLNKYTYALQRLFLWECQMAVSIEPPVAIPVVIYAWKKTGCDREDKVSQDPEPGPQGFGNWEYQGKYECCSDSAYPAIQDNCTVCNGLQCRKNDTAKGVVRNDVWVEGFPKGAPIPPDIVQRVGIFPNDIPEIPGLSGCSDVDEIYRKEITQRYYKSFFREYPTAAYERDKVEQNVPQDSAKREEIPVACYGIYDTVKPSPPAGALMSQEDAKIRQIENKEKRCVIAAYYDQKEANFWKMKDTQKGKGHYGENLNVVDDPFNDPDRDPNFDEEKDMWYQNLGGGFSLLNDKLYHDQFEDDLTFALLAPDEAKLRASGQTDSTTQLISSGALLRAFDDTVSNEDNDRRSIVEWWQELETEMHSRLSPPMMRVLLPAPWSIDLDPLDPLYTPEGSTSSAPPKPLDTKLQPIEVQLHAGEDTLGDVVSFLERSFVLRLQEKPMQVMVPLASSTELRALAHGWQNWADAQSKRDPPIPISPDVNDFIRKLNEYADYIDQVRQLRGELPQYIGDLLSRQQEITDAMAEWLVENIDKYQEYIEERQKFDQMRQLWQAVQGVYRQFHDMDAMPWCRNDRFTMPIYSLLDPWMPGRDKKGDLKGNDDFERCTRQGGDLFDCYAQHGLGLPHLPKLTDPNIEVDFTVFSTQTGQIILPILKPVQIRLDISQLQPPGLLFTGDPTLPELADLPPIPTIFDEVNNSYPEVTVQNPPPTLEPPELDPESVDETLQFAGFILTGMAEEYKMFWEAVVKKPKPGTEQDCLDPHKDTCIHFEMDLWERLQRIGARPAIFLQEDFKSVGDPIDRRKVPYDECPPSDWACQLLHATEREQREGWQTTTELDPDYGDQFDKILERVREESDGVGSSSSARFPYQITPDDTLPVFRNPPDVQLAPFYKHTTGSSSSSSS